MNDVLLQVDDLRCSYATPRGRMMAVNGVSFALKHGETFGLVGESGSGKTTTAMAILQLLTHPARIEGGRVLFEGVDLLSLPPEDLRRMRWSKIALIPQGAMNSLNPVTKIKDQIEDAIVTHEGPRARHGLRQRIIDLLRTVGLPDRVYDMYPHELSGGMKQRVCIAMAIALGPRLIVADEPTSALDVVVQRVVAETLDEAKRRLNASMILIGHDMGLQAQMVDRLGIMYRGKLVEMAPVRSIFKRPQHPYTQMLIASIPSIKQPRVLAGGAASGKSAATDQTGTARGPGWGDIAADEIPALREVHPGHFVAL